MKSKYKRSILITSFIISISTGLFIIFKNFKENIVFFYTPSEIPDSRPNQLIRIGGVIEKNTIIKKDGLEVEFVITDYLKSIKVTYKGFLPSLFREEQGVVAKGNISGETFIATEILAKHDENYMPKEVADKLKQKELWR